MIIVEYIKFVFIIEKQMKTPWFRLVGIIYIPKTFMGWLILVAGIVYAVYKFLEIDSKSHSASDTLRPFFIHLIIIWALYSVIAYFTSRVTGK
jgi:hypothetical protein